MIERLPTSKIIPEKPKNFHKESYAHAEARAKRLRELIPSLPEQYSGSVDRISRFIRSEDAKHHGKSWEDYFWTIRDFQLYANLNPGWIGKSTDELNNKFNNISDGFMHFNQALELWIGRETKDMSEEQRNKSRNKLLSVVTKRIEITTNTSSTQNISEVDIPQTRKINSQPETSSPKTEIIKPSEVIQKTKPEQETKTISQVNIEPIIQHQDTEQEKPVDHVQQFYSWFESYRQTIPNDRRGEFDEKILDIISR